ncbi:MAG: DUF4160 domain-containing protein [Eubacterium sp.]|nr:DUF4160 domain-containing protein [Eubacterium sp.]
MPKCFSAFGYVIFFWSNENDPLEPIYVHVAKKVSANATKIWILSDGSAELENNNSKISAGDLRKLLKVIEAYAPELIMKWEQYFDVKAQFRDKQ